ncbi:cobalamin biosynthesis protein CobD [Anaerotignum lactatifermentans]|uniref:Cobalamin biosynthesis protein CobD n=1 Tax=Anaerotignum lactatifermentans TaxID=160404 RepID=A0ABS2GA02_9FIRM|nr:adenosylcobinamide-phosphate synthase CbiB [Anaerotignum lactatifermentans]MBM6829809.1 cobalamin biosynthesis protein CobD [Anaerotignum lactatifermentans]MBM6878251.1 cobalamin biosynthesis protein CobD [Anaerotignum lactatifermentans]MBM6951331.1 cobalamin biosynthesis protein CobD [Anaerotignum lactatifermentans]
MILLAAATGFLLDLLLGDPNWMPHPVVWMGKAIGRLEGFLRKILPETEKGQFWGGVILAEVLPLGTAVFFGGLCLLGAWLHPAAGFFLQTLWCWQALALKGLAAESENVRRELEKKDLPAARKAVSRIVGRDTQSLTEEGVTKAAVETVAENFSDGVAAPLCYMLVGGAPLAMVYKSINTMDSMVGYRNERYLYFGRAAARLDDAANFLPSRLAALLWIAGAALAGFDGKNAWRIWRRDRRNHASPNSAQTEAACAGALGTRLAGPASYFGKRYDKPYIGDAFRQSEPEDIRRANRMLYISGWLALGLGLLARGCVIWLWR